MTCPSFGLGSPESEGAGNAGCALHPRSRVQWGVRKRTRAYRFSGGTPAFPAQWLYGLYRALPGRAGLVVTVAGGIASTNLTPASGRQDHTTSPYAAPSPLPPTGEMPTELKGEGLETPVVCTTLDRSRENPPCNHDRARRRCVHRIQPRVRDDRDTPLLPGWMDEMIAMICPTAKAECFFE